MNSSVRTRLAATLAGVGAFFVIAAGITLYETTARSLNHSARQEQSARAQAAGALLIETGRTVLNARVDDPVAPIALQRAADQGKLATDITGSGKERVVWAATPIRTSLGRSVYVSGSLRSEETALAALRDRLLVFGTVGVLLAALLGWLLAGTLSRRLREAATTADRIAAGDLSARINATGNDEIARLGRAVDGATAALTLRLEREQRFSAHVAHELRTPLTALQVASGLLGEGRPAEIVRTRTRSLAHLVDELLELARLDARKEPIDPEPVDFALLLRRISASLELDLEIEPADPGRFVVTDSRHLERVLTNVLSNAQRHGAPPFRAAIDGAKIVIRDAGDGFPDALLDHGPERFWSGSASGVGLGLSIAIAHAEQIGARLEIANDDGARVTITVPSAPIDLHATSS